MPIGSGSEGTVRSPGTRTKASECGDPCAIVFPDGGHTFKCQHTKCANKKWPEIEEVYGALNAVIRITPDLHENVRQAICALTADPTILQRVGLVEVVHDAPRPKLCVVDNGAPRLRAIPAPTLKARLSAVAQFEKWDARKDKWVHCLPSDPIVSATISAPRYADIPKCLGVVSSPVLRSDGTIAAGPGYDPLTGLYIATEGRYPPLMPVPAAVALLMDLLVDFPFQSEKHRAGWFAALITLLVRLWGRQDQRGQSLLPAPSCPGDRPRHPSAGAEGHLTARRSAQGHCRGPATWPWVIRPGRSGTVQTLTNRAVQLLQDCGVELIVMDEFHHLFDADRAKVMTKASQWLKVLIVNTAIPVVVCGMPEAEYVLSAEHTERRFKERLTLRCFTWRTPQGRQEFCAMLKRLDETLPLAELSGLAEPDLAGRFYLACRGVSDYLMTLVRGAAAEAIRRKSECIELADLARVYERKLAQQRVLAEQTNPFIGKLDQAALDRVQAADQARVCRRRPDSPRGEGTEARGLGRRLPGRAKVTIPRWHSTVSYPRAAFGRRIAGKSRSGGRPRPWGTRASPASLLYCVSEAGCRLISTNLPSARCSTTWPHCSANQRRLSLL